MFKKEWIGVWTRNSDFNSHMQKFVPRKHMPRGCPKNGIVQNEQRMQAKMVRLEG